MSGSKSRASLEGAICHLSGPEPVLDERARRLQRRVEREHAARHEAERLLESKSLELFALNQQLLRLNGDLEDRVLARTRELEQARQAALRLVEADHLTDIPSRFRYTHHLNASLEQSAAKGGLTGLLLIDIDDFKRVNDTLGHSYGDQLLVTVARRLQGLTRRNELVARIGGDEFGVILEEPDRPSLIRAAERFRAIFDRPVTIGGVTLRCSGSMGLAISPDHSRSDVDLQRFADLALYKVKARGGDGIAVFDRTLLDAYLLRQRIEQEFRAAVSLNAIDLWYQPIVDTKSGRIEAVEALARWSDSARAPISPDYFIPLAEECGLIRAVGRDLLKKALRDAGAWVEAGLICKLTFNVSPIELLDDDFAADILTALREAGFPARSLVLEITEGVVLRNVEGARKAMIALRKEGVTFALDDFGCGYANLSSLRLLPISILKLDRSLLVDVVTDEAARTIVRNVVALCHDLGVRAVCEGAELAGQLAFLRETGCDAVQGFLCGMPAPVLETGALLASQPARPRRADAETASVR